MSIYPNVTEQDLINLSKLAEQQKNQRAIKIRIRNLKQTHDEELAETFSPINNKLEVDKCTEKLREVFEKTDSGDINTQTPSIQNVIGTQSLRDTLTLMMRILNFFKLDKTNGDLFWNGVHIKPLGQKIDLGLKMKSII